MDLTVARETVRMSRPVFDTSADHPMDCDIVVPDYCPDIARVLRTEAAASVDSTTLDSGRLTVTGTFSIRVVYIPENSRNVRCVPYETAFSHTFDLKDPCERAYTQAGARVVFANCRPVGPRRLQIRASLAVSVKAWCEQESEFLTGCDNGEVETRLRPVKVSGFVGAAERQFDVSEELEVPANKPPVSAVIHSRAAAVLQDCKLIHNKIIAKGEVLLKTLYACDSEDDGAGRLEVAEHSIPISQILDMDGVEEDCGCDADFIPGPVQAEVREDGNGENRILTVHLIVTASARAYRTQEIAVVTDAFSPRYEMQMETKPFTATHVVDRLHLNDMVRQTVDLPDTTLNALTDCDASAQVKENRFDADGLHITGDLTLTFTGVDDTGGPVSAERTVPFEMREEFKGDGSSPTCEPRVKVLSVNAGLTGPNRVDARAECEVNALIMGTETGNSVSDMAVDEEKPAESAPARTLTLYFADEGESLWNIAKRYRTPVEAVKRENDLEDDTLPARSMLLIPRERAPRAAKKADGA